jgi:hypothetical protein
MRNFILPDLSPDGGRSIAGFSRRDRWMHQGSRGPANAVLPQTCHDGGTDMKSLLKWIMDALEASGELYCLHSREDLINNPDRREAAGRKSLDAVRQGEKKPMQDKDA